MSQRYRPQHDTPADRRPRRATPPLAVIDIGSNSGRVTVMRRHANGHLEVVSDARFPLRLASLTNDRGRLSAAAIQRTIAALHDFRAIALGAGATRILAVATSAVREAPNGIELLRRVREQLGLELVVLDGEREATFSFLGAVHGLPVDHGILFDLGGGSLEVSHFRHRRLLATWTLPLGALRLSGRFLATDPPTRGEVVRLRKHVLKTLRRTGVPALGPDEALLGTGGTIRNLAKIEARSRRDPLPHIHGMLLERTHIAALARRASGLRLAARAGIPGLNRDRADSILGGLLALQTAMEHLGARTLQVSGQGLREGIALASLGRAPAPASEVRAASLDALVRRFATWKREPARRRTRIARRLLDILEPGASAELREVLAQVCLVLDIGRSIDYYDRHRNAAVIVAAADLQGFTPRGIALPFAVLMHADNSTNRLKALRPVLRAKDGVLVERAATLLLLADEIERRSLPGQPIAVRYQLGLQSLLLRSEILGGWRPRGLPERFRRAFGLQLRILRA